MLTRLLYHGDRSFRLVASEIFVGFIFLFLIPVVVAVLFSGLFSYFLEEEQDYVHIKAYNGDTLLLEYTGAHDSYRRDGDGYSFTVDEKTYILKNVDRIEVEHLGEKT